MTAARRSDTGRGHPWTFWLALVLVVAGLGITLAAAGSVAVDSWQQQQLNQQWQQEQREAVRPQTPEPAGAVFAVRIPKLGYYAAVRQGVTLGVLGLSPGHYPSTAWPGQPGNVGVAAHNVFWINFGALGPGDEIIVDARYGTYLYRVTGTQVVSATDVGVLAQDARHQLTLTTCWPLWAGAMATQRYVISALEES